MLTAAIYFIIEAAAKMQPPSHPKSYLPRTRLIGVNVFTRELIPQAQLLLYPYKKFLAIYRNQMVYANIFQNEDDEQLNVSYWIRGYSVVRNERISGWFPSTAVSRILKPQLFNTDLLRILYYEDRPIPRFFYQSYEKIKDNISEMGLFRLSANAEDLEEKADLINETLELPADIYVATVCGLVKKFFRELPMPLMKGQLASKIIGQDTRKMCDIIKAELKNYELNVVRYLFYLLHEIIQHSAQNKMTAQNLSVVFAPNLWEFGNIFSSYDSVSVCEQWILRFQEMEGYFTGEIKIDCKLYEVMGM